MRSDTKHWLLWLALLTAGFIGTVLILTEVLVQREANQTNNRAQFFATTVEASLERLDHLPFVIANDPGVRAVLQTGNPQVNDLLAEFSRRANAEAIFVLDTSGLTIAASNHDQTPTFLGESYTFRPYFQNAISGGQGRFFAIGATTGRPGYFVSDPVRSATGDIIGVVAVKLGLEQLDQSWRDTGEQILVTNEAGVVILASDTAHLFQTLGQLSPEDRATIAQGQQFSDRPLDRLDWQTDGSGQVTLNGIPNLLSTAAVPREGWQVHLLTGLADIRQQATLAALILLAAALALILALTSYRSAQLNRALALSNADRTRLNDEITTRVETETALRRAQDALERNSRLAALGQLAASITHELGQPISAMRNYLTAEEIAANKPPGGLNTHLSGLVDRMARITDQLRFFATPSPKQATTFDLRDGLTAAQTLVAHKAGDTALHMPTLQDPVHITGNQHRFEQVLVNVLRNGIEAATGDAPTVTVNVTTDTHATVTITDTGPGLGSQTLDDLTEPFVTTKSSGDGMGLGLAISAQIMDELGGTMTAQSTATGAAFTLTLPLSEDPHG